MGNICKLHSDLDDEYKNTLIEMIGCVPPYWDVSGTSRPCRSLEQMRRFAIEAFKAYNENLEEIDNLVKPCIELKKFQYDYTETQYDPKHATEFSPGLVLEDNEKLRNSLLTLSIVISRKFSRLRHLDLKVWLEM